MEFSEKVALVTGASRRIGASLALAFGRRGASVVVNYLSGKERAERIAAQVKAADGQALSTVRTSGQKVSMTFEPAHGPCLTE